MLLHAQVTPSYGSRQAVIRWRLQADYNGPGVLVFRSMSGVGPWDLLTPDPITTLEYQDEFPQPNHREDIPYYRLLVLTDGDPIPSPIIRPFEGLTRREYGMCRRIIQLEYKKLILSDGVPCWFLKHKSPANNVPGTDPDTGQVFGPVCDAKADYSKLFHPAMPMRVHLKTPSFRAEEKAEDMGVNLTHTSSATTPGFPTPVFGDMIVHPAQDDRYAIMDVQPFRFKGVVPVKHEVTLVLLARSDRRYKVPVPVWQPDRPAVTVLPKNLALEDYFNE